MKSKPRSIIKKIAIALTLLLTPTIILFIYWLNQLDNTIQSRLSKTWFVPPIEIYSAPIPINPQMIHSLDSLRTIFKEYGYKEKSSEVRIREGEFSLWPFAKCQAHVPQSLDGDIHNCVLLKDKNILKNSKNAMFLLSAQNEVIGVLIGDPLEPTENFEMPAKLFAQYYGDKPVLREVLDLGSIPLYCSQAVTAIEDRNFLDHKGFSPRSFIRAAVKILMSGRFVQGGSTITQQLIKNYFLTSEKTIKRKFTEIFMALILEARVSKETILENYLNVIYLGQNGPFEVRGFGAAARHYMNKDLEYLNLSECALLAAVLNSPGRYNPFTKPEKALERRNLVLDKMLEYNMIDSSDFEEAMAQSLPKIEERILLEPAPYYVQGVLKEIKALGYDTHNLDEGLKVYTYLDTHEQKWAQKDISNGIKKLETSFKSLKDKKEAGKELQGLLISVSLKDGGIRALVGGKSFRNTQYNRALESQRQVGSIMKPFVYLYALEGIDESGSPYTPLTLLENSKFTYEYEGQTWSPRNYSKEYSGPVPLYYALKNSLNIPTARLGVNIGLEGIIDVARRLGIESNIQAFPSLTLGAFEIKPLEVINAYAGIARFGRLLPSKMIQRIEDFSQRRIYSREDEFQSVLAPEIVSQLIGMMKQTMVSGTARSSQFYGFQRPAAGKTGTTSDTKDTWFVGFTPHQATLVWVGYDDNTEVGMTGATAALPVWLEFMKKSSKIYPKDDFNWPDSVEKYELSTEQVAELIETPNDQELSGTELIFIKGTAPKF